MARLAAVKRRKKLLYEIGMAIVLLTVFISVLNFVSINHRIVILSTKDLLYMETSQGFINTSSGAELWQKYNVSDVATIYDDNLYITVYAPRGYDRFYGINFWLIHEDGTPVTFKELISMGINGLHVELELDTPVNTSVNILLYKPFIGRSDVVSKTIEVINGSAKADIKLDTGAIVALATEKGVLNDQVMLALYFSPKISIPHLLKLRVEMYGVSKKPILAIIAEPLYAAFTAIASALYAAARRIKQYALSAFGGLSLATLFSGLTGSAIAATVLGLLFFVIMVELKKRPAR